VEKSAKVLISPMKFNVQSCLRICHLSNNTAAKEMKIHWSFVVPLPFSIYSLETTAMSYIDIKQREKFGSTFYCTPIFAFLDNKPFMALLHGYKPELFPR
jgi:hypothetical protein